MGRKNSENIDFGTKYLTSKFFFRTIKFYGTKEESFTSNLVRGTKNEAPIQWRSLVPKFKRQLFSIRSKEVKNLKISENTPVSS